MLLLASQPALAACTPQSASNVTATCTGITINQGGAPPGGSDGSGTGYGTGNESGITVNVVGSGATVTGDFIGISINDGTITNAAGASIKGTSALDSWGIVTGGSVVVNNSGSISGVVDAGILAGADMTVTNNAGATITAYTYGLEANGNVTVTNGTGASITAQSGSAIQVSGSVTLINSGTIATALGTGIAAGNNMSITNNAGGAISGEIAIAGYSATIINSGAITGTDPTGFAIAVSYLTVTNNSAASITGGTDGILGSTTVAVTNSGSIRGTSGAAIHLDGTATVTNDAAGSIMGGQDGIRAEYFGGRPGVAVVVNSGSIAGTTDAGIFAFANASVTNNAGGSITGGQYGISAGGGGSTVFNAGLISGGTAAIQFGGTGNSLTLAPGSVITGNVLGTGSDTFQLGGSGTATFDVSQLGAAAQYRGFGTFNKIGSSAWTLTGTSTFAGPVNVNSGMLSVNGDISSASSLTVNAGGTLGGNGIVGNTTVNGGTLSPGNSIGLLTVKGNLVFTAASSYLVEVSPTNADRTNVTGKATLGGATVNAALVAGTTTLSQRYTILSASGGLVGTFNRGDGATGSRSARGPELRHQQRLSLLRTGLR